jgi:hypothetical protein
MVLLPAAHIIRSCRLLYPYIALFLLHHHRSSLGYDIICQAATHSSLKTELSYRILQSTVKQKKSSIHEVQINSPAFLLLQFHEHPYERTLLNKRAIEINSDHINLLQSLTSLNGPEELQKILPVRSHMSTSDCPSHPAQIWDLVLDSALLFLSMRVTIYVLRHFLQIAIRTAYPPPKGPIPQGLRLSDSITVSRCDFTKTSLHA